MPDEARTALVLLLEPRATQTRMKTCGKSRKKIDKKLDEFVNPWYTTLSCCDKNLRTRSFFHFKAGRNLFCSPLRMPSLAAAGARSFGLLARSDSSEESLVLHWFLAEYASRKCFL